MAAQQPRGLRLSYARLHSARATVGITPRPGALPKGSFATYLRGLTDKAVPIAFPFFALEKLPRTTKEERAAILQHSRDSYAEPWKSKAEHGEPEPGEAEIAPPKKADDDPLAPSPEL